METCGRARQACCSHARTLSARDQRGMALSSWRSHCASPWPLPPRAHFKRIPPVLHPESDVSSGFLDSPAPTRRTGHPLDSGRCCMGAPGSRWAEGSGSGQSTLARDLSLHSWRGYHRDTALGAKLDGCLSPGRGRMWIPGTSGPRSSSRQPWNKKIYTRNNSIFRVRYRTFFVTGTEKREDDMTENERGTQHTPYDQSPVNDGNRTISRAALLADMEQVFTEARPRLLRLAHLNGMSPDIADDVVQETMMEAWRHIEKLRDPQRFHAWLDGICRNVCRRYQTPDGALHRHFSLSTLARDNETTNAADALLALPDPAAIDPAEELSQRDLATLLDRAMEYLSPDTRKLLQMCYLAEIPQREVALQMRVTIGVVELRLHRARKQLRQVLNGELRADAESLGPALDSL